MPEKKSQNIDINKALERIVAPSVFDQIVKEIDANEIPTEYIERIVVYYNNGTVVELSGDEISHPVPINRNGSSVEMDEPFGAMKEVKVFVNTEKLEKDINALLEIFFKDRC